MPEETNYILFGLAALVIGFATREFIGWARYQYGSWQRDRMNAWQRRSAIRDDPRQGFEVVTPAERKREQN